MALSRWHFVLLISYNFRNTVHCVRTNTSFIMWSPLSVQLHRGLVQLPRMCVNLNSADFQILEVFLAGYILHLCCFIFSWFCIFIMRFFCLFIFLIVYFFIIVDFAIICCCCCSCVVGFPCKINIALFV